jgi:hypothetical protein
VRRVIVAAILGALFGALGSSSCGCPLAVLNGGTYIPSSGQKAEPDYKVQVSKDVATVTETFTRAGKAYKIVYTTTPI